MSYRPGVERLEARDLPAVPFHNLPVLPFQNLAALDHARAIFAHGQRLGRSPHVVLKIGDSNSSPFFTPNYLAPLGDPGYDPNASGLGVSHRALLDTWWAYRTGPDSFAHEGPTARLGWRTDNVLAALAGEVGATNPGIALVMIGTNDAMVFGDAALFRGQLTLIIATLLRSGVVPVLSTIPDSHFGFGKYQPTLMAFNQVIANVAARHAVPLWNVWSALHRLPNHGLQNDGVHLNASPNGSASFWPADLLFAQNVRNLQALEILDWFRESVAHGVTQVPPTTSWQPLEVGRDLYAC